jgi:hypothetical protein
VRLGGGFAMKDPDNQKTPKRVEKEKDMIKKG